MSFSNGQAIMMRDVVLGEDDQTTMRCSVRARIELCMRKYYRQIIGILGFVITVLVFTILIKRHGDQGVPTIDRGPFIRSNDDLDFNLEGRSEEPHK